MCVWLCTLLWAAVMHARLYSLHKHRAHIFQHLQLSSCSHKHALYIYIEPQLHHYMLQYFRTVQNDSFVANEEGKILCTALQLHAEPFLKTSLHNKMFMTKMFESTVYLEPQPTVAAYLACEFLHFNMTETAMNAASPAKRNSSRKQKNWEEMKENERLGTYVHTYTHVHMHAHTHVRIQMHTQTHTS